MPPIPIIDVFAGPGGLGEGFSSLPAGSSSSAFRLALSVEKEAVACRTLRLRAIRRRLSEAGHLDRYFELLRREISRAEDAKEKKSTMETYWVPGVNNLGSHGHWAFAEFGDVRQMQADFAAKVEAEFNSMIEAAAPAALAVEAST